MPAFRFFYRLLFPFRFFILVWFVISGASTYRELLQQLPSLDLPSYSSCSVRVVKGKTEQRAHRVSSFWITHRFRKTRKHTLNKKRYDKTTTRLQSSLISSVESRLYNRDSFLTIETRFSHSRLDSHLRDSILTIETHFSQSRLDSPIESHFSQSSLFSHNRVSFHTIESRFTQSSLVSHNRVHRGERDWDRIPKEKIYKCRLVPRGHQREQKLRKEMKVSSTSWLKKNTVGLATFFCKPGFLTIENTKLIFLSKFVAFHPK